MTSMIHNITVYIAINAQGVLVSRNLRQEADNVFLAHLSRRLKVNYYDRS